MRLATNSTTLRKRWGVQKYTARVIGRKKNRKTIDEKTMVAEVMQVAGRRSEATAAGVSPITPGALRV
jgi:hypothetical protein